MDFGEFFHAATGKQPYKFQTRFAEGDLVDVVPLSTGFGKTSMAVLGWLWKLLHTDQEVGRRLVFCLPMRTLVDQTQKNVKEWLGNLVRAKLLQEDQVQVHVLMGGSTPKEWGEHPDKPMVLIGTQDQLLSRALNRGYGMSRYLWPVHFAWLNNDCFWVVDETQLQGSGLSTSAQLQALRESLGTFGPAHTLWMSATLPLTSLQTVDNRNKALKVFELSEPESAEVRHLIDATKVLSSLPVPFLGDKGCDFKALAKRIVAHHRLGNLTLVVVNQVKTARLLYAEIRKLQPDALLIHSKFRPVDRAGIQSTALRENWKGILVSTQAVEAGVDLSADTLVTEVAPWSSLIQRFGRCNRNGTQEGRVFWMPLLTQTALPYEEDSIRDSIKLLEELPEVSIRTLQDLPASGSVRFPVIRRKDILDLFDTQASLDGFDIDISAYVRDLTEDSDVSVCWRDWVGETPNHDMGDFHPSEICSVPIGEFRGLLKKSPAWCWDTLEGDWVLVSDPVPGRAYLVKPSFGGYYESSGWTGNEKDQPCPVEVSERARNDSDDQDPWSTRGKYVTLKLHSKDAGDFARLLVDTLANVLPPELGDRVVLSAAQHDIGKAHSVFQTMLTEKLEPGDSRREVLWAKSERKFSGKSKRPGFRHELASALMFLQDHPEKDLEAYLILAHHGKARMSIRSKMTEKEPPGGRFALGVWDTDVVSYDNKDYALSNLDLMGLGRRSWVNRVLGLVDQFGPFRLAFMESLVRVADWRASNKEEA